jgi:hypothetical protein
MKVEDTWRQPASIPQTCLTHCDPTKPHVDTVRRAHYRGITARLTPIRARDAT